MCFGEEEGCGKGIDGKNGGRGFRKTGFPIEEGGERTEDLLSMRGRRFFLYFLPVEEEAETDEDRESTCRRRR